MDNIFQNYQIVWISYFPYFYPIMFWTFQNQQSINYINLIKFGQNCATDYEITLRHKFLYVQL